VGARGAGVHLRCRRLPVTISEVHCLFHFFNRVHHDPLEVLHVETFVGILANIESAVRRPSLLIGEEVKDVLFVDLQVTALDKVLHLFLRLCTTLVDAAENMREAVRDNATLGLGALLAHHSMGLTAASLTVCKDSTIVAFQHVFN